MPEFLSMTTADFEQMTAEQLEAMQIEVNNQKDAIKDKLRELVAVLDTKLEQKQALRRFEQMSDSEKAALIQHVKDAGGIDSSEAFSKS